MKFISLVLISFLLSGCAGPKIPVCLWSSARIEFDCVDENQKAYVCPGADMKCDKYVATTPAGFNTLTEWVKRHSSGK